MPRQLSLSYYPWISQRISGPELEQAIADFVRLLQTALGNDLRIDPVAVMEVSDQIKDMKTPPTGDIVAKIALMNPIGYALAHRDEPDVRAIAVIRRKIGKSPAGPTYKAQLYTHVKTGIQDIKHVRGRSVAFGSPQSTSNFLVPAMMLQKAGIPLKDLSRVEFTGGHDTAAMAVYKRRFEVGAGHDGVIVDLASKAGTGNAAQVLVRIDGGWSDPIPSDPVAIHASDDGVQEQVTQALLEIAKPNDGNSEGNQAILRFWATKEGFDKIYPVKGKNSYIEDKIYPDDYDQLLNGYDELLEEMKHLGMRT